MLTRGNSHTHETVLELIIQYQIVSPKIIHMSNIQPDQVIFRNVYVFAYTCIHVSTTKIKKDTLNCREQEVIYMEGFQGRKGTGEIMLLLLSQK